MPGHFRAMQFTCSLYVTTTISMSQIDASSMQNNSIWEGCNYVASFLADSEMGVCLLNIFLMHWTRIIQIPPSLRSKYLCNQKTPGCVEKLAAATVQQNMHILLCLGLNFKIMEQCVKELCLFRWAFSEAKAKEIVKLVLWYFTFQRLILELSF